MKGFIELTRPADNLRPGTGCRLLINVKNIESVFSYKRGAVNAQINFVSEQGWSEVEESYDEIKELIRKAVEEEER